jgi:hypothetical protein
MNIVISGIVAAVVLGVVAAFGLRAVQAPAYHTYATSSTRVGDPGYNLVGQRWNGRAEDQRNNKS